MSLPTSSESRRPFQFRLWHLFWVTTVVAAYLGITRLGLGISGLIVVVGSELFVIVMGTAIVVSRGPPCRPARIRRGILAGAGIASVCLGWYPVLLAVAMYDLRPLWGLLGVMVAGGGLGFMIAFLEPLLRPTFAATAPPHMSFRPSDRLLRRALDRATDRVMGVLATAKRSAAEHRHQFITPQHLLWAISTVDRRVTRLVLERLGVEVDELSKRLAAWLAAAPAEGDGKPPILSRELECVLDLSRAQAETIADVYRRTSDVYVGTEHLVLGLLAYDDCLAARYLASQGITLERYRAEFLKLIAPRREP